MKQFQKFTIIAIVFILSIQSIYAQDVTMAKAFFAKAQQAYVDKDYENTIELLEKTKEKLGKTNPEIVYLEAKSRYEHDININKTKELMQSFLKTADKSDERLKELAGILADIEVSDNYFSNGQKKVIFDIEKGNIFEIFYLENGKKEKVIWKYKNRTVSIIEYEITSENNISRKLYYTSPQYGFYVDKNGKYNHDNITESIEFHENLKGATYYQNGRRVVEIKNHITITHFDIEENVILKYYYHPAIPNTEDIWYNKEYISDLEIYFKGKLIVNYESSLEIDKIEYYTQNSSLNIHPEHRDLNLGIFKRVNLHNKENRPIRLNGEISFTPPIYEFDKTGLLRKIEYYNLRGTKMKSRYIFDFEKEEWIEQ